jgi:peroxiredoxin
LAEGALGVGEAVPRFTLPDALGSPIGIGELLHHGPVVLSFYRGGWCPYCNLELRALEGVLAEITSLGASLVAISPELPDSSLSTAEKNALTFPVLSDHGNQVAGQFRIVHPIDPSVVAYQLRNGNDVAAYNGTPSAEAPLPATYVIEARGTIRFASVDTDYTRRAEPAEILDALRSVVTDAG